MQAPVQPDNMDYKAGVLHLTFDKSGTYLITAEKNKIIKLYKKDDLATKESHPVHFKPESTRRNKF